MLVFIVRNISDVNSIPNIFTSKWVVSFNAVALQGSLLFSTALPVTGEHVENFGVLFRSFFFFKTSSMAVSLHFFIGVLTFWNGNKSFGANSSGLVIKEGEKILNFM